MEPASSQFHRAMSPGDHDIFLGAGCPPDPRTTQRLSLIHRAAFWPRSGSSQWVPGRPKSRVFQRPHRKKQRCSDRLFIVGDGHCSTARTIAPITLLVPFHPPPRFRVPADRTWPFALGFHRGQWILRYVIEPGQITGDCHQIHTPWPPDAIVSFLPDPVRVDG